MSKKAYNRLLKNIATLDFQSIKDAKTKGLISDDETFNLFHAQHEYRKRKKGIPGKRGRPSHEGLKGCPTPEEIKLSRSKLRLTQKQAACLIEAGTRSWQNWEHGIVKMHPDIWGLWKKKADKWAATTLKSD